MKTGKKEAKARGMSKKAMKKTKGGTAGTENNLAAWLSSPAGQ